MSTDTINRWLTLGANFGVLVGIFLLVTELNQNSYLMRAQIFNERSSQGVDLFMSMAVSEKLSEIDAILEESGFPNDPSALSELTPGQRNQYFWFMRANRFRIENLLFQQTLGIMEFDQGPISTGRTMVRRYEAFGDDLSYSRLVGLLDEVERMHE